MSKCIKIAICGAPSTRKSTICAGLEAHLRAKGINAETSKEFAREYIAKYGVPSTLGEALYIQEQQYDRDALIEKHATALLSDTPPMASYLYAVRNMKTPDRANRANHAILCELYGRSLVNTFSYDIIIVLPLRVVVNDGVLTQTDADVLGIHDAIMGFLRLNQIFYHEAPAVGTEEFCKDLVDSFLAFRQAYGLQPPPKELFQT